MAYSVHEPNAIGEQGVYDGPVYIGYVGIGFAGCFAVQNPRTVTAVYGAVNLSDIETAIEWLVAEHREIPWFDRPKAQRIDPIEIYTCGRGNDVYPATDALHQKES